MEKKNNIDKNLEDVMYKAARIANLKKHAESLSIPVLKGLEIINDKNPHTVFLAKSNIYVEQLTSDGHVEDNGFEERIDMVIAKSKSFLKEQGIESNYMFHKDYKNNHFNYKVYVCDMTLEANNEKKIIRQFNAYFIEPRFHDFYQLSLSIGPIILPTKKFKPGIIDLKEDMITRMVDGAMTALMNNLKYK